MSVLNLLIGLEEFTQEVTSEIATDAPDVETTMADQGEFQQESGDINDDLDSFQSSAQALEDIISLVEEAPGAEDKPMEPFVEKAVNVAMEANDLADAGAPTADKEQTKGQFLAKAKEFAKKVFAMLANMATKIIEWIKAAWAKATDRLVKNTNKARSLMSTIEGLNSRPGASIENEKLLAAVASAGGKSVDTVIQNVFAHARNQAEKAARNITAKAMFLVDGVASGKDGLDSKLDEFFDLLCDGAGTFSEKATAEQAAAAKAPNGAEVLVSEPFFGGLRAWVVAPASSKDIKQWNHGLSKLDEVKPIDKAAPDVNELKGICEFVIDGQGLIKIFQGAVKPLEELQSKLKAAASKASDKTNNELLKNMQSIIPRIVKGTQVDAYNYAGTASSIALAYVDASLKAHQAPAAEKAEKAETTKE